jgi:hypothetical protein
MILSRRTLLAGAIPALASQDLPDISTVPPDLVVPPVTRGAPAPGKRVRMTDPDFARTDVHHTLYLPTDWEPGGRFPVIVEYAGNGDFQDGYGDVSTGEVEGSKLGYGICGGSGCIWVCMPYVDTIRRRNQPIWWGDVNATKRYAANTVRRICERYWGDPTAVILTGFSRGAIACNYIGLHDDAIARLWLAFVAYSHYDGVVDEQLFPPADRGRSLERLRRLKGRAVFICQERSIDRTRAWIESTGVEGAYTYQPINFRNHSDAWTLRDIPERRVLRQWLKDVLRTQPGR